MHCQFFRMLGYVPWRILQLVCLCYAFLPFFDVILLFCFLKRKKMLRGFSSWFIIDHLVKVHSINCLSSLIEWVCIFHHLWQSFGSSLAVLQKCDALDIFSGAFFEDSFVLWTPLILFGTNLLGKCIKLGNIINSQR